MDSWLIFQHFLLNRRSDGGKKVERINGFTLLFFRADCLVNLAVSGLTKSSEND